MRYCSNILTPNRYKHTEEFRARQVVIDVLVKYISEKISARSIIQDLEDGTLESDLRDLVRSLALGTVRYQNTIDFLLSKVNRRLFNALDSNTLAKLRLQLYETRWLGRDIDFVKQIYSTNRTELKLLNSALLIDLEDLLRNMPESNALSLQYSHPTFIIDTLLENVGRRDTISILSANNNKRSYFLRPNRERISIADFKERLTKIGLQFVPDSDVDDLFRVDASVNNLISSDLYRNGEVIIQDKGSLLVVEALNPHPHETVIDICSAPGGKTQLIWEKMNGNGLLVAGEFYQHRILSARKRLQSLGISNIQWIQLDAVSPPISDADKILIDAPCTSTGMIQTHPSFKWALNKERLLTMMSLQNKILEGTIDSFIDSPNTEIVYATCSILPHEGESQIDSVLSHYPIELIKPDIPGAPGYPNFNCSPMVKRLFTHRNQSHGFFISKFKITN